MHLSTTIVGDSDLAGLKKIMHSFNNNVPRMPSNVAFQLSSTGTTSNTNGMSLDTGSSAYIASMQVALQQLRNQNQGPLIYLGNQNPFGQPIMYPVPLQPAINTNPDVELEKMMIQQSNGNSSANMLDLMQQQNALRQQENLMQQQILAAMMMNGQTPGQAPNLIKTANLTDGLKPVASSSISSALIGQKPTVQPANVATSTSLKRSNACLENNSVAPSSAKKSIKLEEGSSVQRTSSTSLSSASSSGSSGSSGAAKKKTKGGKICSIEGCTTKDKGGGLCAKHGGGRPCHFPGCSRIVAGVRFCTPHGGIRKKLCSMEGCKKGDQGGGFCASHGGGRRCKIEGCTRRDISQGLCWSHGGGRRCKAPKCLRCPSSRGYCKEHIASKIVAESALTKMQAEPASAPGVDV